MTYTSFKTSQPLLRCPSLLILLGFVFWFASYLPSWIFAIHNMYLLYPVEGKLFGLMLYLSLFVVLALRAIGKLETSILARDANVHRVSF